MNYFGAVINNSPTIAEIAGAEIKNGGYLFCKYDDNGNVALCATEGEITAGILLPDSDNNIKTGDDVTLQIKDIGYAKAGGPFKKGAELMVNPSGKVVAATSGKFIAGYALSGAEAEDDIISIDIRKSGYKA